MKTDNETYRRHATVIESLPHNTAFLPPTYDRDSPTSGELIDIEGEAAPSLTAQKEVYSDLPPCAECDDGEDDGRRHAAGRMLYSALEGQKVRFYCGIHEIPKREGFFFYLCHIVFVLYPFWYLWYRRHRVRTSIAVTDDWIYVAKTQAHKPRGCAASCRATRYGWVRSPHTELIKFKTNAVSKIEFQRDGAEFSVEICFKKLSFALGAASSIVLNVRRARDEEKLQDLMSVIAEGFGLRGSDFLVLPEAERWEIDEDTPRSAFLSRNGFMNTYNPRHLLLPRGSVVYSAQCLKRSSSRAEWIFATSSSWVTATFYKDSTSYTITHHPMRPVVDITSTKYKFLGIPVVRSHATVTTSYSTFSFPRSKGSIAWVAHCNGWDIDCKAPTLSLKAPNNTYKYYFELIYNVLTASWLEVAYSPRSFSKFSLSPTAVRHSSTVYWFWGLFGRTHSVYHSRDDITSYQMQKYGKAHLWYAIAPNQSLSVGKTAALPCVYRSMGGWKKDSLAILDQ